MWRASQALTSPTPSPFSAEIMKVAAKVERALAVCASASSALFSTKSTLLMTSTAGCRTLASLSRIASASSSAPLRASSRTATRSASCAPPHALVTIARSSRRLGRKIPGESTNTNCDAPSMAMPRMSERVVCTLCETMVTFEPTSALSSVDLPTFGAPISATNPQRVGSERASSAIRRIRRHAFAGEHGGGGGLLGGALGASDPLRGGKLRQLDGDAELRVVVRAGALELAVGGGRQAAGLRPFLQQRLRVA